MLLKLLLANFSGVAGCSTRHSIPVGVSSLHQFLVLLFRGYIGVILGLYWDNGKMETIIVSKQFCCCQILSFKTAALPKPCMVPRKGVPELDARADWEAICDDAAFA